MYHCIKQCFDKQSVLWTPGEISESIPDGMDVYFKAGPKPIVQEPSKLVYLSQYAKPAFEVNPDGPMPISEYGKPTKKVAVEEAKPVDIVSKRKR